MRNYLMPFFFICALSAQPDLLWQTVYPDEDVYYQALSVVDVSDTTSNGFLVSGTNGWGTGILTKFNDSYEDPFIEWENLFSSNDVGAFYSTIRIQPNLNIAIGYEISPENDNDAVIASFDDYGSLNWLNTFGGEYPDYLYDVNMTISNDSLIACGQKGVLNHNGVFWIVKTDLDGNVIWEYLDDGEEDGVASSIIHSNSINSPIIAVGTYGDRSSGWLSACGRIVIRGGNNSGYMDETYCDESGNNRRFFSVTESYDSTSVIIAGYTTDSDDNVDMFLMEFSLDGNGVLWEKTYDFDSYDVAHSVKQNPSGGYSITGFSGTGSIQMGSTLSHLTVLTFQEYRSQQLLRVISIQHLT